jgi:hypothetical protein
MLQHSVVDESCGVWVEKDPNYAQLRADFSQLIRKMGEVTIDEKD